MTQMVVTMQPFTLNQGICIYSDGNLITSTVVEVSRLSDVVRGLSSQYSVDKIDLVGNEDYLSKFKAEIGSKFAVNEMEINIIRR